MHTHAPLLQEMSDGQKDKKVRHTEERERKKERERESEGGRAREWEREGERARMRETETGTETERQRDNIETHRERMSYCEKRNVHSSACIANSTTYTHTHSLLHTLLKMVLFPPHPLADTRP